MGRLDEVDLSHKLPRREAADRLAQAQRRLTVLRLQSGGQIGPQRLGPPPAVLLEGWDAAGKGGAIRRMTSPLDPRHFTVAQFAAPTEHERRHHFMWRFWPWLPGWGGMTVFDRTWYARVLVERVEGFASEVERLIAAESKWLARVTVLETVIEALEAGLRSTGQEPVSIEATL